MSTTESLGSPVWCGWRPAGSSASTCCSSTSGATSSTCRSTRATASRGTAAGGSTPTLNKLGSGEWIRTKRKVRRAVREMAFELIQLYAYRESGQGIRSSPRAAAGTSSSPNRSRTPKRSTRPRRSTAVIEDMESMRADGSPGVWRRWLRQDRGCDPGRVQGGQRRPAGGDAGANDRACAPALQHLPGATGRLSRCGWRCSPACARRRSRTSSSTACARDRRHRDRHAPDRPEGHAVQGPRPGGGGRGAAIRGSAQGVPQAAPDRGRRADDVGDADSAHARTCRSPASAISA